MTESKEKTVYVSITGDIIHPGIINVIKEGAKYGKLIVGLLTDKAVVTYKRLPYLTYEQRKEIIENIKGVSDVVPQDEWSAENNLKKLKPDYVIHGDDWKTNHLKKFREECFQIMKEIGGSVIEIPYTQGIDMGKLYSDAKKIGTTPDIRLKNLRRLINAEPIVRILEAHSGLSGVIVENLEVAKDDGNYRFDGLWCNNLSDSIIRGKPDIEAVNLTTRFESITDILECTTKPIIYDGGNGDILDHFVFMVKTLERNGISAVVIDDTIGFLKSDVTKKHKEIILCSQEEFCNKIKAGKNAQVTKDFMIIAKILDIINGKSVDEAIEKSSAAINAGADGILIETKSETGLDIKEFCSKLKSKYPKIPIVLMPNTYSQVTEKEFKEWGANLVIYANQMLCSSYPAMLECAKTILENERSLEANNLCMPIKEILGLIPGTS